MGTALYAGLMIVVVVAIDVMFLRNRLWARLLVNAGLVLIFAALYLIFLRRS